LEFEKNEEATEVFVRISEENRFFSREHRTTDSSAIY